MEEESEEEEPPPVPPRSGRRPLTEEPSSETPTETDGTKRRRTSVPKDTGSVSLLCAKPETVRKKRKKYKKKWKGIVRFYSCTTKVLAGQIYGAIERLYSCTKRLLAGQIYGAIERLYSCTKRLLAGQIYGAIERIYSCTKILLAFRSDVRGHRGIIQLYIDTAGRCNLGVLVSLRKTYFAFVYYKLQYNFILFTAAISETKISKICDFSSDSRIHLLQL